MIQPALWAAAATATDQYPSCQHSHKHEHMLADTGCAHTRTHTRCSRAEARYQSLSELAGICWNKTWMCATLQEGGAGRVHGERGRVVGGGIPGIVPRLEKQHGWRMTEMKNSVHRFLRLCRTRRLSELTKQQVEETIRRPKCLSDAVSGCL